jgi:hypothetical protein
MKLRHVRAAALLELSLLRHQIAFVVLTVIAGLTFLVTMSLFGLTGSELPLAVVDDDQGAYAARLVAALRGVRHAFLVLPMDAAGAEDALRTGQVLGAVTIPSHFTEAVGRGDTVAVSVRVDNLNTDLTSDLERAIPNAILSFGQGLGFAGLRVRLAEKDLVARETGFLAYVSVSALGLDALILAGVLGALAMAREWEGRTVKLLRLAPDGLGGIVAGKVFAASIVAALAMTATSLLVTLGYGVVPLHPALACLAILLSVLSFASLGVSVGAILRRTQAIVPLIFGSAIPLYIDCGALEPTRFDGEWIWRVSHLSPLYYATGLLEWTFHGLRVTPEPVWADAAVLVALAALSGLLARVALARGGRA